jgi:hypothetical protein
LLLAAPSTAGVRLCTIIIIMTSLACDCQPSPATSPSPQTQVADLAKEMAQGPDGLVGKAQFAASQMEWGQLQVTTAARVGPRPAAGRVDCPGLTVEPQRSSSHLDSTHQTSDPILPSAAAHGGPTPAQSALVSWLRTHLPPFTHNPSPPPPASDEPPRGVAGLPARHL